jgi:hypothetical protein
LLVAVNDAEFDPEFNDCLIAYQNSARKGSIFYLAQQFDGGL